MTQPELRITPAGNPLLRLRVDCGERTGELVMPVVMAGGEARILAEQLKVGSAIHLTGALRLQSGRSVGAVHTAIEIAVHQIDLLPES